ncbi:MAG TPA: hypothetical protein VM821_00010 [Abditibacteriaceae bacterium]|jgi:gas vesicle protein|nr:hypothetical protein [Abditibacteriaceae bacterium]
MMDNDRNTSKYWRGLVTGVMIGAGTALVLAQRKRQEKFAGLAIDEGDVVADEPMNSDVMGETVEEMDKDALDVTLDMARQTAHEVKQEDRDTWNQTLEEAKTSATDIQDLSKTSTNDN